MVNKLSGEFANTSNFFQVLGQRSKAEGQRSKAEDQRSKVEKIISLKLVYSYRTLPKAYTITALNLLSLAQNFLSVYRFFGQGFGRKLGLSKTERIK